MDSNNDGGSDDDGSDDDGGSADDGLAPAAARLDPHSALLTQMVPSNNGEKIIFFWMLPAAAVGETVVGATEATESSKIGSSRKRRGNRGRWGDRRVVTRR